MLAHFAHHLMTALPVPLLPFIRDDFSLDYTKSAWVNSAFSLIYGAAQIPAGWLADRIGPRFLLIIGICGTALAGVLVGLSQNFTMLIVFMVVMGILGGGYHPAAAPMVSASVDAKYRGRALGFHEIGASASFLVAPIIAAGIASAWGWRSSFIGLAIPALILGLIFFKFAGKPVKKVRPPREITGSYGEPALSRGNLRRLVVFMFLSVFTGGVVGSVTAFLPLYMVDKLGASEVSAASFYVIHASAGIWASPMGGYLSDRLGRVPLIITSCLISAAVVFLLKLAPYGWGIGILILILGMATFMRMPVSEAYIIGQTTERHRSMIYGIYYFSMTETGAIFAPIMGHFIDNYDFYNCFTGASIIIAGVTLLCAFFLRGSRN